MKIFLDTEFVERGPLIPLKLVSVGMVREDGTEFYGINGESLSDVFRHPWLSINVLPYLPIKASVPGSYILEWDQEHPDYASVVALDTLAEQVRDFILGTPEPELWAWYGAYDHVVLCQMFGDMTQLPKGVPMWTGEMVAEWKRRGEPPLLRDPENAHHALADARWNRAVWGEWERSELLDAELIEEAVLVGEVVVHEPDGGQWGILRDSD